MLPTSVALFATCLVDLFYPQVGEATVCLLRCLCPGRDGKVPFFLGGDRV